MTIIEAMRYHNSAPEFLARLEAKQDPTVILKTDEIDEKIFSLMREKERIIDEKAQEFIPKYRMAVEEAYGIIERSMAGETSAMNGYFYGGTENAKSNKSIP